MRKVTTSKIQNIYKSFFKLNKKSKEIFYNLFFQENKNNLVKVWNGIKEIILIKITIKIQPKCLKIGNNIINDGIKIVY